MTQVLDGKAVISGDPTDEYLYLVEQCSNKIVRECSSIMGLFSDSVFGCTDVDNIPKIVKGMANSKFKNWYKRRIWKGATENDLKFIT